MTATMLRNNQLPASRGRICFYSPLADTLLALMLPGGGDVMASRRNFAPSRHRTDGFVIGAPIVGADHVGLNTDSSIQHSDIAEQMSFTFLWIGSVQETDLTNTSRRPHLLGWGGDGEGAQLICSSATQYRLLGLFGSAPAVGPTITATISQRAMIVGTVTDGVGAKIYNMTAGTSSSLLSASARAHGYGANKLHIGGKYSGTLTGVGAHSTYMAACWSAPASDAQVAKIGAWARGVYAAINGIAADF